MLRVTRVLPRENAGGMKQENERGFISYVLPSLDCMLGGSAEVVNYAEGYRFSSRVLKLSIRKLTGGGLTRGPSCVVQQDSLISLSMALYPNFSADSVLSVGIACRW